MAMAPNPYSGMQVTGMNPDGTYIYGPPPPNQGGLDGAIRGGQPYYGWGYGGQPQMPQQQYPPGAGGLDPAAAPGATPPPPAAAPTGPPTNAEQQAFLPNNLTAPYYNLAGVTSNLGTISGQAAPAAGQFMQGLFNPNLNAMEQQFMQAGLGNAMKAQEQSLTRMEGAYENMPFHSSMGQQAREITEDTTRNLMQQGSQLGLARQQLAAQSMSTPFELTAKMAEYGPATSERMFNLGNQAQSAGLQVPLSIYSQVPITAPTVISQPGQQGGGMFGK